MEISFEQEKEAIENWLIQRTLISSEQSEELPIDLIEELIQNPRQGLERLFKHFNRNTPNKGKLKAKAIELAKVIEGTRSKTGLRLRQASAVSKETNINKEGQLDQLINDVESSFLAFENRLRECANQMPISFDVKPEEFYSPFEAVRINQNNQQRNFIRRLRQILCGEASESFILENPYQFFYDFQEEGDENGCNVNAAASFSSSTRTILLPEDHDHQSLIRLLVQYHELRHANQDATQRIRMSNNPTALQAYYDFRIWKRDEKPRVLVTEEASAYAYEMEALNVLLKGKLQNGSLSADLAMNELGCKPAEYQGIKLLLNIARHYFPERMSGGVFSKRFIGFMRDVHIDLGYDVYILMTSGKLKQLK